MTILALKLSRRANAVSSLHGQVSRAMWTPLFPGRSEEQVPIGHITNGIHVRTWLAQQMHQLYDRHLGPAGPTDAPSRPHGTPSRTSRTASYGRRARRSRPALIEVARLAPPGAPTTAANRPSSSIRCSTRSASTR